MPESARLLLDAEARESEDVLKQCGLGLELCGV